ncbi:methane monooxygenase/ammonia monooxygenase subunit B [Candidatus Nitrosoglobus terrae]|uniref:Methane monooxygenase/ammonia monooxygenase subunit B n=1 Tax=Candidatus Nitrosoglobus terrae TaxID=1630141 RepID=A0A1Q2SP28_9GAMM|nr:bacterial ammonia monooxygenase, subunit AmoB [Candidatus Nitrosoglobus terrae]BAW80890.1 methane monooxygenase/ammonia monooxygenase subunit B [Candidatus Nitrosoglobus terrae]
MKDADVQVIKNKVKKWLAIGFTATIASSIFYVPTAAAHGEKSQAAFLRMRTIHWYDLKWSADSVAINDTYSLSGKFHVFSEWPEAVSLPRVSFLNIGQPGPVFVRTAAYINDVFVPRSVGIETGGDYTFHVDLKARRVGEWHIHAMMNVEGGGPLIGPGKWVTITGNERDFTDKVTTLTGQTVDLENVNLGTVVGWHLFWLIIGLSWMVWWVRRPLFLSRYMRIEEGDTEGLITEADKKAGLAVLVGVLVIIMYGYKSSESEFPITIPLQAGLLGDIASIEMPYKGKVTGRVISAGYRVPGRTIKFKVEITNNSDKVLSVGSFETGGVRFLNSKVTKDKYGYPEELLAPDGLEVSQQDIGPGETAVIDITGTDAAWEVQRLADVIYDPDSRFGGLLFLVDPDGNEAIIEVGGPLIPTFA